MAVRYGTFRICVLRTSQLEPYRTSIPHFSLIFEAYRNNVSFPYHYKKGVPYQRTVLLSKNWGVPYRTYIPYRTAILVLNYTRNFTLTLKSLAYKSAILIYTFSVDFSCLLPLHTKSRRMSKKSEIFNPLSIQLKCRSCFRSNFSPIYDMPR